MWNLSLSALSWILSLFGFGKTTDAAAAERASGVSQGAAEQKVSDQQKVLDNVSKAQTAARDVDNDIVNGVPITESDGFRRD